MELLLHGARVLFPLLSHDSGGLLLLYIIYILFWGNRIYIRSKPTHLRLVKVDIWTYIGRAEIDMIIFQLLYFPFTCLPFFLSDWFFCFQVLEELDDEGGGEDNVAIDIEDEDAGYMERFYSEVSIYCWSIDK